MRKTLVFFAVLLFMAMPAMAGTAVTITCTEGDCNEVIVSYSTPSDNNLIRAFGLDITTKDANIVKVVVPEPNYYRIYPGQIAIASGNVTSYGAPYATGDLGDKKVTIEMGSLYTTDSNYSGDPDAGYNKKPARTGVLLKFYTDGNATDYSVDVNALRGGVVMEDVWDVPTLSEPNLCTGHLDDCIPHEDMDFGDAPNTYPTLSANNGPSHIITGLMLGATIDPEPDGQPSVGAVLDDTTNTGSADDEDGVVITTLIAPGSATVTASAACILNAWMDFNGDGDFADAGEQIFTNQALSAGPNVLAITVPAGAKQNLIYSRWRVNATGNLSYTGAATEGEVEDYATECLKSTDPGYTAWKNTWGMPKCWCFRKQCKGDVNGSSSFGKPVSGTDLDLFKLAFNKTDAELALVTNGICADLNHAASFGKRVTGTDNDTFKLNFNVAEASVLECASTHINFWTN
jgi:hypothetical protein